MLPNQQNGKRPRVGESEDTPESIPVAGPLGTRHTGLCSDLYQFIALHNGTSVIIEEMLKIDVDDIVEISYSDSSAPGETNTVEVTFKNGAIRVYEGDELPEALAILNHWTPPTA